MLHILSWALPGYVAAPLTLGSNNYHPCGI